MSLSAIIGALRVDLGLETAAFKKGLDDAKAHTDSFVAEMKKHAKHLAEAFELYEVAEGIKKVVEGFLKINEQIDLVGKTAQKIGIPIEELSKLQYAAKLADVPIEDLNAGMAKFDKALSEAAATGKGTFQNAMNAMGISIKDNSGHVKTQIQLMGDIAESMSKHADGAYKTALANGIIKKTGYELIPMWNEGRKGIEEASAQLENFGGVLTPQAAEAAKRFNDDLKILFTAFYSLAQQGVILIDQSLNPLLDSLVKLVNTKSDLESWGKYFKNILLDIEASVVTEVGDLQRLANAITFLTYGYGSGQASLDKYHSEMDRINNAGTSQIAIINDLRNATKNLDRDRQGGSGSGSEDVKKPDYAPFGGSAAGHDSAAAAAKRHAAEVANFIEKLKIQNEEFSKGALQMKIEEELRSHNVTALSKQGQEISWLIIKHAQLAAAQQTEAQEAQNLADKQKKFTDDLTKVADWGSNAMQGWIDGTKSLTQSMGDLLGSIEKLALNAAFKQLLGGMFGDGGSQSIYGGGSGGGGILSQLLGSFAGMFADGGTIPSGKFGIVGEGGGMQHAELVAGPASVIPMSQMGGGVKVNVNNYNSPDVSVNAKPNGNGGLDIDVLLVRKVNEAISSGSADSALGLRTGLMPARVRR